MKIEHVAMWVKDLEQMKSFYQTYFNAAANDKYLNTTKGFSSYFLSLIQKVTAWKLQLNILERYRKTVENSTFLGCKLIGYETWSGNGYKSCFIRYGRADLRYRRAL